MLDFRKVLLGLAVAGLGLVGSASAQVATCSSSSVPAGTITASNAPISVEGTTELLPVVTITNCSGTVSSATIVLTADVPFTDATQTGGALDISAVANTTAAVNTANCTGGAGPATATTCTATSVVQSGNTITATFNLGGGTLNGFTFTGLRVNASAAPATSAITIGTSGVAGGGVSGTITAVNEALVAVSQVTPVLAGGAAQSLCTAALATTPAAVTTLTIQENFGKAFKTAADQTTGAAPFVQASQGTRVAITFNNLNAGVNYYVPAAPAVTPGGNPLVLAAYAAASGGTALTAVTAGSGAGKVAGQVLLTVTNGSATIYYGVTTSDDGGAVATVTIPLIEVVPAASAVTAVSSTPVTASSYLVGVATGYPQYAPVTTPIAITQPALPAGNSVLSACSTTLLFPYVVNSGGFDTGVAIANASTGALALPAAIGAATASTPTAGSCNVTFYGTGAAATPGNVYSTGTIATATDAVFLASVVQPGIQGYAVAVCNFQGAHGYAFITDGFGGGGRGLSADYLAVVQSASNIAAGSVAF